PAVTGDEGGVPGGAPGDRAGHARLGPGGLEQMVEQSAAFSLGHRGRSLDGYREELAQGPLESGDQERVGQSGLGHPVGPATQLEAFDGGPRPEACQHTNQGPGDDDRPSPADDGVSKGDKHGTMVGLHDSPRQRRGTAPGVSNRYSW